MSDPRVPRGEAQPWSGSPPQNGPLEYWRPVQVFHVELACPSCRRGRWWRSASSTNRATCTDVTGAGRSISFQASLTHAAWNASTWTRSP
jgi:hypothetical protein